MGVWRVGVGKGVEVAVKCLLLGVSIAMTSVAAVSSRGGGGWRVVGSRSLTVLD